MFEFLLTNGSGHQTSVKLIMFSFVLTLILSLLLVLVYEKTSRQVSKPDHFIQSLVLMSLVTSTIMQSIGDSLALSFGIFGALAMIRFRTRISDPRDVAFIFASMAVGIACGVHSFLNGIIGTLGFSMVILIIRFSPFGRKSNMLGELKIELPYNIDKKNIENILNGINGNFSLKRMRLIQKEDTKFVEYDFKIKLENMKEYQLLIDEISKIDHSRLVRFNFEDENDLDII